jgi:hypothetical protein
MLTREHQFKIRIGHTVRSIVVEECIPKNSGSIHLCSTMLQLSNLKEKKFFGTTPEEVARQAARYLLRNETLPIDTPPALKSTQRRSRIQMVQELSVRNE